MDADTHNNMIALAKYAPHTPAPAESVVCGVFVQGKWERKRDTETQRLERLEDGTASLPSSSPDVRRKTCERRERARRGRD